jgi:hypothetical protein
MNDGNARGLEFSATQAFGPKASNVRFESGTVQRLSDLGHLSLTAAKVQFASHQQHWPRHQKILRCRLPSEP